MSLDCHAIDFGFDDIFDIALDFQKPFDSLIKFTNLCNAEGIIQTKHGDGMDHRLKGCQRRSPDTLGRRIRRNQLRKRLFQFLKFTQKPIIFSVRDFRIVENVVVVIVAVQFVAQRPNSFLCCLAVRVFPHYPLIQPSGRSLATFLDIPAIWQASTTSVTSL